MRAYIGKIILSCFTVFLIAAMLYSEYHLEMKGKRILMKRRIVEYGFLGLLIIQFGFILFFNLSDIRCSLDPDFANTIYHYMEVIKSKNLKLQDWYHTTSLELDGSMLFALPLYYLIGDIFKSVGISNIIITVLYLVVIRRILKEFNIENSIIYLTLTLIITPYAYGMLDWFNMLFYGGACYSIKTIVPILLLLILILLKNKSYNSKWKKIELLLFSLTYFFLLFITSFSTGIFVALCGLLPIFIWMFIKMFLDGVPKEILDKKIWIIWGVTATIYVLGYLLHKKVYNATSRTNMNLTNMGDFRDNFIACIRGIYELMGAVTKEDVSALSVDGIILCVKMLFVTGLLVSLFYVYIKYNNKILKEEATSGSLKNYLSFMFLWIFMVMFLVDMRFPGNNYTEYRYFIIGVVPLIILLGFQLNTLINIFNNFQKVIAYIGLFIVLLIIVTGNNKNVLENWDRSTYAVELTEYVDTLGVDSVIFVLDVDSAVMCKGIDNSRKYGAYLPETGGLYLGICSYYESGSGQYYDDHHALIAIGGTNLYDCMAEEVANNYVKIDQFKWFDIYMSDVMMFP